MADKPTPKPAPVPQGPGPVEHAVIILLAAIIVAVIWYLIGPAALAALGSIFAGF